VERLPLFQTTLQQTSCQPKCCGRTTAQTTCGLSLSVIHICAIPLHPMRATCKLQRKTFQNEMHRCPGTRRSKFQKEIEATKGPKGFQRGVHRVMFPSVKSRDRFDHETHVSKLSQYLRHTCRLLVSRTRTCTTPVHYSKALNFRPLCFQGGLASRLLSPQLSPWMASPECAGQPLQRQPVSEQRAASAAPGAESNPASALAASVAAE